MFLDLGTELVGDADAGGRSAATDKERGLILAAAARLAASEGYEALSVPRIRTMAGVSRRNFDAHFDGVADCFLAALDQSAGRVVAMSKMMSRLGSDSWPGRVHRVVVALCSELAGDAALGRIGFVEVFSSGREGVRWRTRLIEGLSESLRNDAPPGQRPSALAAEASVGAVCAILRHHVATGRAQQLPAVAGILSYILLAPAIGAEEAATAIRVERERVRSVSVTAPSALPA
jgi:AcrR family transcriptional regulator